MLGSTPNPTTPRAAAPPPGETGEGSCLHARTGERALTRQPKQSAYRDTSGPALGIFRFQSVRTECRHRCSPSPEWAPLQGVCLGAREGRPRLFRVARVRDDRPAALWKARGLLAVAGHTPPRLPGRGATARSERRSPGKARGQTQLAEVRRQNGHGRLRPVNLRRPPDFPHAGRDPLGSGAGRSGRESGQYMR